MEFTRLFDTPVPVWAAAVDAETYAHEAPLSEVDLLESFGMLEPYLVFRSVSIDRLPVIMSTGIDVEPTTAPIFVDDFEKAWEYGGWPKVTMALDPRQLERTSQEIAAGTPADEIARLMEDYPTRFDSEDGEFIWLTRLNEESSCRATSAYERLYACWIRGDPLDVLIAAFVFMPSGHAD